MKKKIIILVIILILIGAGIGIWGYQRYKTETCKRVCHYKVTGSNPYWIFQPRGEKGEILGVKGVNEKFSDEKECIDFCFNRGVDSNWK